jgi:ATP-dependent DNA helicase RecQ
MPGSPSVDYLEIGRAGRDGGPAHAVLVYDPRTVRIPRLLAAKSKMGDASVHAVVDALEAASGRITLRELAEASKVSRQGVERVVDELLELEVRRAELLGYFGEHYEAPCAACDNDTSPGPAHRAAGTSLPQGVPVRHRLWGPGVLLSRDEHELVVAFDSVGYRHLTAAALTNGLLTLA